MSVLYLHVGHGKTGSSYLQSALALSQDALRDNGIFYSLNEVGRRAAQGKITSGNGNLLDGFLKSSREEVGGKEGGGSFLFSSEVLFHQMLTGKGEKLLELIENQSFEKVKVLLFVRDPLEHASSSYQQSIKRGGGIKSFDEFIDKYSQPKLVCDFISRIHSLNSIELTIKNYSKKREDIVGVLSHWLGVRKSSFTLPAVENINRSMTHSEIYLQREFNKNLGPCGHLISDPLCETLPEIKSDRFVPSLGAQKRMLARLEKPMMEVESFMGDREDCYSRELVDLVSDFDGKVSFDVSQVEVFAKSLSRAINNSPFDICSALDKNGKLGESIRKNFGKDPADVLRDIAVSLEVAGNIELAYFFMLEAGKFRPGGKTIIKKIDQYQRMLKGE